MVVVVEGTGIEVVDIAGLGIEVWPVGKRV